ncbi:MAG: FAD-dependent oxidoreductase, partial [Oscillospiraceae bacterium]|nr:FAD-dependent oxidoreductase [Oscillospiraceae bacterium]
ETCKEVIVVQDLDCFTGEERLASALTARPNVRALMGTAIEGLITDGGVLKGLRLRGRTGGEARTVDCSGLFVSIGLIPENAAFRALVPLDGAGYILSGEDCGTGRPGVYAAGDCRKKQIRQLTTAVADGACAALAACDYINGSFR